MGLFSALAVPTFILYCLPPKTKTHLNKSDIKHIGLQGVAYIQSGILPSVGSGESILSENRQMLLQSSSEPINQHQEANETLGISRIASM